MGRATMEVLRDSTGRMAIETVAWWKKGAMNDVRSGAMRRPEGIGVDEW
jgi:hypothetical protein